MVHRVERARLGVDGEEELAVVPELRRGRSGFEKRGGRRFSAPRARVVELALKGRVVPVPIVRRERLLELFRVRDDDVAGIPLDDRGLVLRLRNYKNPPPRARTRKGGRWRARLGAGSRGGGGGEDRTSIIFFSWRRNGIVRTLYFVPATLGRDRRGTSALMKGTACGSGSDAIPCPPEADRTVEIFSCIDRNLAHRPRSGPRLPGQPKLHKGRGITAACKDLFVC